MDAIVPPEEGRQPVAASLRANQCGGVEEGEGKRRGGGGGRTHSRGDLRDRRRRRRRKKEDLASWALEVAAEKGGGEVTTSWGEERKGKLFPQVEEADEEEERKKRRRRTRKLLISTTSSFSSITPSAATAAAAAPGGGARDASAVVVGTRPPASSSSWCHPLVSSFRRSLPRASPMHVAILMVVMALGTANAVAECMCKQKIVPAKAAFSFPSFPCFSVPLKVEIFPLDYFCCILSLPFPFLPSPALAGQTYHNVLFTAKCTTATTVQLG